MICPITYESCDRGRYSSRGLRLLSPRLTDLDPFPYGQGEAVQAAAEQKSKMSISGAQPKLGAQLSVKNRGFEVTAKGGAFILKPGNPNFVEVPANEAATMHMAAMAGIPTPLSGMIYDKDGGLVYFVKRFDRSGKRKLAVEDFGQLLGLSRTTKYDASIEDLVRVVREFASFPALEMPKLYGLIVFNFLVGNEDAHVKNFSLLTSGDGVVRLSPAYDLVDTTIVYPDGKMQQEESALPLRGKKRGLVRDDLEEYLGRQVMGLPDSVIEKTRRTFTRALQDAANLIASKSFLSEGKRRDYLHVLAMRRLRLGLHTPLPDGEYEGYLWVEEMDGLPYARLESFGTNRLFSITGDMERFDGRKVGITSVGGEMRVREARN